MQSSAIILPALLLSAAVAPGAGPAPDWVKVTDKAGWQARDSSGEVVFKDQLWILGGWFNSFAAPPRDVWSSSDGKTWRLVTREAPWKYSDLPMTLAFKDRMYLMGGWFNGRLAGHGASNEVWSSADGKKWERVTKAAGWSPRLAAGVVAFKGRMWVLGGTENYYFGDDKSLKNDVWSSADGKEWKRETARAPWSPRAYHAAVVHDGKIWVLGGGNYVPKYHALNDVWCSSDGVRWERATGKAPWHPRIWFSSVVYRDRIWVLGGWSNNPSKNWGDVWYSRDGKGWTQLQSKVIWKARHEHSAYVFKDKIWVAGGHAQPLSSEVWSLEIPKGRKPADTAPGAGRYYEVSYPASDKPGALRLGVTYTLWVPDGVRKLRGLIVHQHGCGSGACKGGATAAYDLHWQALARKWDCALLGPSYHQDDRQNCRLWCDPRNGSGSTFLRALRELAGQSKHPELEQAPWCLWGHSGGGFWASLMQTLHPERIVAVWFRSGTAFLTWEKGGIPKPAVKEQVYQVPMMCNPGAKEKGDKRFNGAWEGTLAMFKAYRAKGAPIGFAPDPRTAHECGDSRYLAIPFFDACLAMRLPDPEARDQKLKPVDRKQAWLAEVLGNRAEPAAAYRGPPNEAVWLPNARVAKAWAEYVKTGDVRDSTSPPPPFHVKVSAKADGGVELTWSATADFESGLGGFIIRRDGKDLARLPEKPGRKFGKPLFQAMSYHDTPEKPLPRMRFLDRTAGPGPKHEYRIIAVNGAGLKSEPSKPVSIR